MASQIARLRFTVIPEEKENALSIIKNATSIPVIPSAGLALKKNSAKQKIKNGYTQIKYLGIDSIVLRILLKLKRNLSITINIE